MLSPVKTLLLLAFLFTLTQTKGQQKEANTWYFGLNAGLDFNYSPPKALTNGALQTFEGCASICNKHGNLLFYTDGVIIYDKNHVAMPNGTGLTGHTSSTQSGMIIQNPDSASIYYVFSISAYNTTEMAYTIVDTTLNSGKGDVRVKNVHLMQQAGEKITAIRHSNGIDTWVLAHQHSNNSFYAYLVSGTGVNAVPVISSLGQNQSHLAIGCLKSSPDGRKLAGAENSNRFVELYDFDPATGVVSNAQTLLTGLPYYGVEFSPSGKYLYVTGVSTWPNKLYQFDLQAGSLAAIQASKYSMDFNTTGGALQLGPDGKIYMANFGETSLGVINFPEKPKMACNFVEKGLSIAPGKSYWGLPTFNQSFFYTPTIDVGHSPAVCGGLTFNFFNTGDTSYILTSHWDFGDGTIDSGITVTKTFAGHDMFRIRNIVKIKGPSAVTDTFFKDVKTYKKPVAAIHTGSQLCFNNNRLILADSTKYLNGSKKAKINWIFSDSSKVVYRAPVVTKSFAAPGNYTVKVISTSNEGCVDSIEKTIIVYPNADAAFNHSPKTCLNNNVFTPAQVSVIDSPGKITGYWWDFGDGSNSADSLPAKVYADTGTYMVELVALDTNGCNDTFKSSFIVLPSPRAGFTASDACLKDSSIITNTTTILKGTLKYSWDYGDGTTDSVAEPRRQYKDTGVFIIKLIAVSDDLCADSIQKILRVRPKPVADFSTGILCEKNTVVFTDKTIRYNIPVINNRWEFETGAAVVSANPKVQHVFNSYGNYSVKLVTEAANGCKDSSIANIHVNPLPFTAFALNTNKQCLKGNAFEFKNTTTLPEGGVKAFRWKVDGVDHLTATDYLQSFVLPAKYTVRLVAETDSGCFDSAEKNIEVFPQVKVDVNLNNASQCFKNHFFEIKNNSVVNGSGIISNYRWSFSDNSSESTVEPAIKKFGTYGLYSVQGIMETDNGCRDTFFRELNVYFSPEVVFDADSVCMGDPVKFVNTTDDPDGKITGWEWDFGDGSTSVTVNPEHIYAATGNYQVGLSATTAEGCSDTLAQYFTRLVRPKPVASFEQTVTESYERITTYQFTNTSQDADTYLWDFGNGPPVTDEHPLKTYYDTGRFAINLTAGNQWGCKSQADRVLFVIPDNFVVVPNAFTPGKDELNPVFRPAGIFFTKEFEMKVFNRWGQLVFTSGEAGEGWDGTYRGEAMPAGVYMYSVRIMDLKNKVSIYNGSVTLLR
ncbi:MAG TPA: PKD domain-containing protein [Bacteroidia bacterium]|nr:PKD domain-containing protein [Bacteroidia bacterium]